MHAVKIKAHAKINLTLEIVGHEKGFHLLDSLVASVALHDLLILRKREDKQCTVTMKGMGSERIPPENNNALKAAVAFCEKFGVNGVDITVHKNIPLGAGLGGSSADASGVLRGMAKLYGVDDAEALGEIAQTLGSDTKYMLLGGFARMQGRGEKLAPQEIDEKLHLLLLCPPSPVSAGACYAKYDELPKTLEWRESQTQGCIDALQKKDVNEAGRYLTNDLFVPALHLNGDVEMAYKQARALSPIGTVMTGSGSCVMALFKNKAACNRAARAYAGAFRTIVTETV